MSKQTEEQNMRAALAQSMEQFIRQYTQRQGVEHIWKQPQLKYADALGEEIQNLTEVVHAEHYMPQDLLSAPTVILSYFLPFQPQVCKSNVGGRQASEQWARAYDDTNTMAVHINRHMVGEIESMGYAANFPEDAGLISRQILYSRWSQRHIARAAGLGTFGINNMLISGDGCCGRYFSVVTTLPLTPDSPLTQEGCLYKRNGSCGICVKRCPTKALQPETFDRALCYTLCQENEQLHSQFEAAQVCGKCVVGLPCSFICPK